MRVASAPLRIVLLVSAALAALGLVAGCGGSSSEQTLSVGDGHTITVSGDVHGFYGELEAILDQFPYQHWYVACVVREAKQILGPKEAAELEELPEAEREAKAQKAAAEAEPACEKTDRPTIDPNASHEEIELLRVSTVPGITEFAETNGMSPTQVACVQSLFKKLSDEKVIELRNGTDKVREGILVSVFNPCAQLK
ncbi:MAG TPA: hypothetical protein VN522_06225 [Solirubrobacterales bacterium]|nr:hypothetical protein [Solirubrobacterales bacterium]